MIYLTTFHFPSRDEEEDYFFGFNPKNMRNCYTTKYPFEMFRYRSLPDEFEFDDITIICGNNGSGKSTILNVIAEKLNLKRSSPFNSSDFFEDYVDLCDYTLEKSLSCSSRVITSDDVFDYVLYARSVNEKIDDRRNELYEKYVNVRKEVQYNPETGRLKNLGDYDRWKETREILSRKNSLSSFVKKRVA